MAIRTILDWFGWLWWLVFFVRLGLWLCWYGCCLNLYLFLRILLLIKNLGCQEVVVIILLAIGSSSSLSHHLGLLLHLDLADKRTIWISHHPLAFSILFTVDLALQEVESLIEEFNISEGFKMNYCFYESIQRHY